MGGNVFDKGFKEGGGEMSEKHYCPVCDRYSMRKIGEGHHYRCEICGIEHEGNYWNRPLTDEQIKRLAMKTSLGKEVEEK